MKQRVIIIGAGIGGLATANFLAKAGYNVQVIEQHAQAGGRASRMDQDGFRFDTGPSWYLMPDVFAHYFDLLEEDITDWLKLSRLSPAYKVFFENQSPLTITSELDTDAETFETIEPGGGDALKRYVTQSEQTYRLSIEHFLYTNFERSQELLSREILRNSRRMLQLATRTIDRHVSSFVSDPRLKQILEYPTVFLGSSPFNAPAIYSLMSALDFREGVFYPQGGLYTIIESLEAIGQKLGVQYQYGTAVTAITIENNQATGVVLDDGTCVLADIVISNADIHFTESQLLEPQHRSFSDAYWDKLEPGPSAILLYLGIKGSVPELEHHNLLFVDEWKENFDAIFSTKQAPVPASIYVCKPSQTDASVAPKGHENIFVLVPFPAGTAPNKQEIAALEKCYLEQIEDMTGAQLRDRIVTRSVFGPQDFETKFHAWQATMLGPSHRLRQSAFWRTPNKSKKVKGLYFVGAGTTPGVGLPMCLISAELIYKRLSGDKRGGRVKSIGKVGS